MFIFIVLSHVKSQNGNNFSKLQLKMTAVSLANLFPSNRNCGSCRLCSISPKNLNWVDDSNSLPSAKNLFHTEIHCCLYFGFWDCLN